MNSRDNRFAVILAGGEGSRLRSLTRAIAGDERPKQFCPIIGGRTLLEVTRDRASLSFDPSNIFYSLTQKHERFYRPLLRGVSASRLVIQPENKGTAPAILYSLLRIAKTNPDAVVAFLPSDHYLSDDAAFMKCVDTAFAATEIDKDAVVLLGIEPDSAETSYGWIEPDSSLFGTLASSVSRVRRFWEKPDYGSARELMAKGCLWNSFVMVGRASTICAMIASHLPDLHRIFSATATSFGTRSETSILRSVYAWIGESNFSSDVLEQAERSLHVVRVADVTWSDLGEPQRVLGTLNELGLSPDWMNLVAAA